MPDPAKAKINAVGRLTQITAAGVAVVALLNALGVRVAVVVARVAEVLRWLLLVALPARITRVRVGVAGPALARVGVERVDAVRVHVAVVEVLAGALVDEPLADQAEQRRRLGRFC